MKINEGGIDRTLRVILGASLICFTFIGPQTLWGLVGLVPLATGLFGYCPVYSLLGLNTCSTSKN